MTAIRVLMADDHAVLRAGLRMLLTAQGDITVVGEASNGVEVTKKTRELRPDVVLLDLSMPGPRSGDVIRGVLRACRHSRVLVLTMHDDAAYVRAALAAGAAGYIVKRAADSELVTAIRAVYAGRTFVDLTQPARRARRADGQVAEAQQPQIRTRKSLSRQERAVLRLLAQGHSNQEIADKIRVSIKTVETYRTRLSEKLGLKGRAQLYRFAAESGLLDAEPVAKRRGR
jgi:DNA-binding NarL/FixJ family response regulator